MAKGIQDYTVKESQAPIVAAEIKTANGTADVSFTSTTRGIIGMTACANAVTLTLTLSAGGTLVLPNKDAINAMFAPGSVIPFAVDSFKMGGAESTFSIIGIL